MCLLRGTDWAFKCNSGYSQPLKIALIFQIQYFTFLSAYLCQKDKQALPGNLESNKYFCPPPIIISAVPLTAPPAPVRRAFLLCSVVHLTVLRNRNCDQFRSNTIIFAKILILVYFGSFYRPPFEGINKRETRPKICFF